MTDYVFTPTAEVRVDDWPCPKCGAMLGQLWERLTADELVPSGYIIACPVSGCGHKTSAYPRWQAALAEWSKDEYERIRPCFIFPSAHNEIVSLQDGARIVMREE